MKNQTVLGVLGGLLGFAAATGGNALQNILDGASKNELYHYPTEFTQGIVPKAFHSHNDYWRPVPFYSALAHGAISVEADVYLINSTLYVGHELSALTSQRTLEALYIDPILDAVNRQNPATPFVAGERTRNGVYDTASAQTLYLFIDLKTDGPSTFPAVQAALQPLRDADYLSVYDGDSFIPGPVTVIGTGNTPLSLVAAPASPEAPRFVFFDASLPALATTQANVTAFESPIASTDFSNVVSETRDGRLNDTERETLRAQVDAAHVRGILARYWDLPGWPVGTRNRIWRELWDAGVDLINVDDLEAVAGFWEQEVGL